jgi:hypothetical protein
MNTKNKQPKRAADAPEAPLKEIFAQYERQLEHDAIGRIAPRMKRKAAAAPEAPQHSLLPWSLQNGAIYDASDKDRVRNVRLCKLVISSSAIEPQDAKLIVHSVNSAAKLAEALRGLLQPHNYDAVKRGEAALAKWEAAQ